MPKDCGLNVSMLMTQAMVPNPEYERAKEWGRNPIGIPQFQYLYVDEGDTILFPRAMAEKFMESGGFAIQQKMYLGKEVDFRSKIKLKSRSQGHAEDQDVFVEKMVQRLKEGLGAIGKAEPGFGKTICALEIIARLGRKACVVVAKEALGEQWRRRILECYDIREDEIGWVQGPVCDFEDKKIVIALIQSLISREYPKEFFREIGTVVFDEVHHLGADEFRKVVTKFPARYRFGVSATTERKDGLHKVYRLHIGPVAVIGSKRHIKARVSFVTIPHNVPSTIMNRWKVKGRDGKPIMRRYGNSGDPEPIWNMPRVVEYLVENPARNYRIVDLLLKAAASGRRIIALGERKEHLYALQELMNKEMVKRGQRVVVSVYTGDLKTEEQRRIALNAQVVLATYKMAEEDLDIPEFDTEFLLTPKVEIEQVAGRIEREFPGKKEPLIVDFVDQLEPTLKWAEARMKRYTRRGSRVG